MRNFSFKAPDETSGGLSYEYCAVLHRNVLDLYIRALNFSYGYLALRADVWHPKRKLFFAFIQLSAYALETPFWKETDKKNSTM